MCSSDLVGSWFTRRIRRVRRIAALEQQQRLNDERQRIARNMHDDLGAGLTRLAWLTEQQSHDSAESRGPVRSAPELARDLLRSLDETVWVVNPAKDRLESVIIYLGSWVREFFAGTSVEVVLNLPPTVPERPIPAEWRHHLLLVVRESCRNVLRHAHARQAEFSLRVPSDGPLELSLQDHGCGFALETDSSSPGLGGNGLASLRRRALELNGTLEVRTTLGQGTRVTLTVPLPPASEVR
ncbi:MAG TPA: hypothetical protein DCE44_12375 [Verrucomicrobiales bacterium]|nr:hypothetical protein [Verrucomicrobiales bacterium]